MPLPPTSGFDWTGMKKYIYRIEEKIAAARRIDDITVDIDLVPEEFAPHIADYFREIGHAVVTNGESMTIVIDGERYE